MSYERVGRLSIHESAMDSRTDMHISGGQGDYLHKKGMAAVRGERGMNSLLHVRSLSMFQLHGNELLLDQIGNFTQLRVLHLKDCRHIFFMRLEFEWGTRVLVY